MIVPLVHHHAAIGDRVDQLKILLLTSTVEPSFR